MTPEPDNASSHSGAAAETAAPAPQSQLEVLTAHGARQLRPAAALRSHDFRQSGVLTPSELRRVRLRHEQFVRSLEARLGILLRLECGLELSKTQIVSFQKFTESLPNPAHITLFKTEPLKGAGLLTLLPRFALGLVDRLLGGPGAMPANARDLSDIEIALTDQISSLVLAEWCACWPEVRDLRPALLGHESNSRFLQTLPPEAALLVFSLNAALGDQRETIHLAFPYATVEPLLRQLSPALPKAGPAPAHAGAAQWNPEFDDIPVAATAEMHGLTLSAREMTRLKPGDVLLLDPGCLGQVQLCLSQVPKFVGRPGVAGRKWAVQLTETVAP